MCECYKVGGPFIAEDPKCPIHGREAVALREEQEDEMAELKLEVSRLKAEVEKYSKAYSDMCWQEDLNR